MRMERSAQVDGPLIKGFSGGGFRIDDNVYAALLLTPISAHGWKPPAITALDAATLAPMLDALERLPEFVLLGTGTVLRHPPRALVSGLAARGIGVEAMDSRAAARAWGVLRQEGRWIVAALFPL